MRKKMRNWLYYNYISGDHIVEQAVHSIETFAGGNHDTENGARVRAAIAKYPPLEHPVLRTHPETGRKALYCSAAHSIHIEGMTVEESQPILQYLYSVQQRPELWCRWHWEAGSVAFWDNRCAQHNALNDYHGHLRIMHRVTLEGDVPS